VGVDNHSLQQQAGRIWQGWIGYWQKQRNSLT